MGMFDGFLASLFGDEGFGQSNDDVFDKPALADLLPYRLYDPETRLYYNDQTTGFIAEIHQQVLPETLENFHAAILSAMPSHAGIQIINWSSPEIDPVLNSWALSRVAGGDVGETMVAARLAMFKENSFGNNSVIKAVPTLRRRFVAGWIDGDPSMGELSKLDEYRRGLLGAFGMRKEDGLRPEDLISLLADILHAERWDVGSRAPYTEDLPLNVQAPGASIDVAPDFIRLAGEPQLGVRTATVSQFPNDWDARMSALLLGGPDMIADRPHGPVLISLSGIALPAQKAASDILSRRAKMEHSKKTGFARFVTDVQGKEEEFSALAEQLEGGERLFEATMTVCAYARGSRDEARIAMSEMTKIFRRAGCALRQERYLQLPLFLNAFPLGASKGHMKAFKKLMRMRLLKGAAISALAPLHSEWPGNTSGAGMLLLGRQGEICTFSNFVSDGNYNVAVVGKSGAGKSVFMQELITSIYAGGGRALVIDDGYSFKTTCEILGGRHIALNGDQEVRLNPFSMLQPDKMDSPEYAAEAIELITRVVGTMASLGEQREGRVDGIEEEAISRAVMEVWQEKGPLGEITDVLENLREVSKKDTRLPDVCKKLENYSKGGIYGSYFQGQATVDVDSPLTVVELSELKSQPGLEQVVLQLVMFLGTELMYKTDRSVPVAILIDEAWDMLSGQGTAKFIEGVVRRARKYTGALITGTQSIDDYYQNPAAEVCLQNSDWTVFLGQKPETIDRLERDAKLSIPDGLAGRLKSLTSVPGQFAEMAIKGPPGWVFARLALDPFSLAVFSSKGSTVENLKKRKEAGMSTVAALKDMVAKGEVS
jgi:conjugal transfer ATP-binding protein TraC